MTASLAALSGVLDGALYNSTGYLFVVLGILISIRFTGYPDLTVDGSFTFGAALYVMGICLNLSVATGFLLAWGGGLVSGLLTAALNRYCRIGKIISSVLVMIFLITIVPYLTGGSTLGLLQQRHILADLHQWDMNLTRQIWPDSSFSLHLGFTGCFLFIALGIVLLTNCFFNTRLGLQIRYFGSAVSPSLLTAAKRKAVLFIGLALGNGFVAIGGAIEAERKGGFSQNMGLGVLLIGLACLILGESIAKTFLRRNNLHVHEYLKAVICGVIGYCLVLQLLLYSGITFLDVRLTSTVFLFVLLTLASRRHSNRGSLF